jgi:hypothetical protein
MKPEERMATNPDERLTTADPAAGKTPKRYEGEPLGRDEKSVLNKARVEGRLNDVAAVQRAATAPTGTAAMQEPRQEPASESGAPAQPRAEQQKTSAGLFEERETRPMRARWTDIQGSFVDEPRRAVKEADALVAEVMKRLAEVYANERAQLERQWDRGDDVTTEDLRVALQRYHSFFDRLLAV